MTKLIVLNVPKVLPEHKLPSNILKHCNLYKDKIARHSSLFAWICLNQHLDLANVKFNKNGKPFITDKKIYFSLSHSLNKVAIAISDKPVGVDIEVLLPHTICSLLSQRLLNPKQLNLYFEARDREIWFTKYWTQHEAYIKLKGDAINFTNLKTNITGKVKTKQIKDNHSLYFVSIAQKK